jgi:hypothetical protein
MEIEMQNVTSPTEIERLVEINHDAMDPDPVSKWMALYTEQSEDDGTRSALTDALKDPHYKVVQAVMDDPTALGSKQVVGFVHYFTGFIEIPKSSGSKGDFQKNQSSIIQSEPVDEARAARLEVGDAMYVHSRNFYIGVIRGRKHSCTCH